ncbi:AraC family transcriptional regulator [Halobacteriovorax sp.]|uniref:AraC family transcriptional regulator n=1 Tax=Halobacteriovorax sp. TaxID=2020862 RepID=UPI0035614537
MSDSANIPYSNFNTKIYSQKEKIDAYKESMSVVFDTNTDHTNLKQFEAQIHSFLFNEIMLVECTTFNQFFERSRSKIARDTLDHILVQVFLSGDTTRTLDNNQFKCDQGSIIIIDTSRPWKAHNSSFKNITLVIPKRLIRGKVPNEDILHGKILDTKTNPFASLLHSHIISLRDNAPKITQDFAHSVVPPSVDIVCAAISFSPDQPICSYSPDKNVVLILRIKNFIESNLGNSNLTIPLILVEFNLTKSTLYRLFPTHTGGIMNYVTERRLIKAYRSLSMKYNNKTISQIAYESGFENESSFTRAFKRYFKYLPRDVQKSSHKSLKFNCNSPDRLWENWLRTL